MSTCLSCPLPSFFTLTLHPSSATPTIAPAKESVDNLFVPTFRTSIYNSRSAHDSSPALRNIRNADRKMSMHRNLPKQSLHRPDLGYRRIGKCTHIVLNLLEVRR